MATLNLYTSAEPFRLAAPRKGTATAKTRPLTLIGAGLVKRTVTPEQLAEWQAESDPDKRAAILGAIEGSTMKSGRVTLSPDQRAAFVAGIRASVEGIDKMPKAEAERAFASAFVAVLNGGAVVVERASDDNGDGAPDRTESIIAELFAL